MDRTRELFVVSSINFLGTSNTKPFKHNPRVLHYSIKGHWLGRCANEAIK